MGYPYQDNIKGNKLFDFDKLTEQQFNTVKNMFREAGTDTGLLQYIPTKDVYSYGKEGNQYKTVQEYVEIAQKNKNAILNNAQQSKLDNLGKNIQKDIAYNENVVYNNNNDNGINEIERDDYNEESRQESIKRGREPRFYTRGSSTNIEGENIERNRDDRGTIRSTKKSFRVNGKEVITSQFTFGLIVSNSGIFTK